MTTLFLIVATVLYVLGMASLVAAQAIQNKTKRLLRDARAILDESKRLQDEAMRLASESKDDADWWKE